MTVTQQEKAMKFLDRLLNRKAKPSPAAHNPQAQYGSGMCTLANYSTKDLSEDADQVRLLLQLAADQGGSFGSSPSELSGAHGPAERAGWLVATCPPSAGFVTWSLTDAGRQELATRNAKLGPAATRMAHNTRFFPGIGVTTYGAARRVPISQPYVLRDGTVADR